jgi:hypothetical protein
MHTRLDSLKCFHKSVQSVQTPFTYGTLSPSTAEADRVGSLLLARTVPALDVVRMVVEERPEALGAADNAGSLPLYVAVALNRPTPALVKLPFVWRVVAQAERVARSLELVQLLVERSLGSVRYKAAGGRSPCSLRPRTTLRSI